MPNARWTTAPTKALCAGQCQARCCRAPGSLTLSHREANRLALRHRDTLVLRDEGHLYRLNFSENGGQCPMLAADFTCSIYAHRPVACHLFPSSPSPGCFVWPMEAPLGER